MSIHIEDLTVRFKNGVTAINHANLNIPNGIFGLLGENGAGKTTLMRVLTTVLKPTSGTVTLDGILYSEGNYEKIQRKIGYLPQEIELYPNLTVQECLEYMGDLAGCLLYTSYLIPCLTLPEEEEQRFIGVWGQRHLHYLKEYNKGVYLNLLTSGRLNDYLADIKEQAQERFERIVEQMKQAQGITEQLKAENQMEWVARMNNM